MPSKGDLVQSLRTIQLSSTHHFYNKFRLLISVIPTNWQFCFITHSDCPTEITVADY